MSVFAPEGQLRIAQRFIAGLRKIEMPQVPDGRLKLAAEMAFRRPSGATKRFGYLVPAINRWAIVKRPAGTSQRH